MSRSTRTAAEPRRGSFGTLIPFALGIPVSIALFVAIENGLIDHPALKRYTNFGIEKTAVVLFCCAMCALAAKLVRFLWERAACANPPVPAWDGKPIPAAQVNALVQQFELQPRRARRSYIGRRIAAVLDFVACRGNVHGLDDQIRCLADNDALALDGSYTLLRFITWAIPIVGFLGTVLGITGAISGITPEVLEKSLSGVTDGLAEAFDTTALALFLTMILMFFCFLVERLEQTVLDRVDGFVDEHLAHRFERGDADTGATTAATTAAIEQCTQGVLGATHQLVARQVDLWAAAVEKTEQLGSKQQERLATAIGQALEFALTRYGKRLAEMEEALIARNQKLLDTVTLLTSALRDTGREHELALSRLTDGLGAQVEALTRVQTSEAELMRLQQLLSQNLAVLAGTNTFEQAVQSLTAAVHMLTARAGGPPTPALRVVPRSDAA